MKKLFIFLMFISAFAITGCGMRKAEPVSYRIEMREYEFMPNRLDLKVGQEVTLELVNSGQIQHEIMIGQNVMKTNNRPGGYMVDLFGAGNVKPEVISMSEGAEMVEEGHHGFMIVLPKNGDTTVIRFIVTKAMVGEWEMGCFEQDGVHYDAGMHGIVMISR